MMANTVIAKVLLSISGLQMSYWQMA